MKGFIKCIGLGVFFALLSSCAFNDDSGEFDSGPIYDIVYIDILENDSSGWIGGIADYPDSLAGKLDFSTSYTVLNSVFPQGNGKVFKISAKNPHSDLFYFLTKKFEGLEPNTKYKIAMTFELQVALITDTTGTFPLNIHFKIGGGGVEPAPILRSESQYNELNLNKGDNESDGEEFLYLMKPFAEISKTNPVIIKHSDNSRYKIVETNDKGELWAVLGIDSNMPLELAFSFNTIAVFFKQVRPL